MSSCWSQCHILSVCHLYNKQRVFVCGVNVVELVKKERFVVLIYAHRFMLHPVLEVTVEFTQNILGCGLIFFASLKVNTTCLN